MAQTKIDGSKNIVFDAIQYEGVKKYLGELYSKTRAKVVLFADMAGQIIGERGRCLDEYPPKIYGSFRD